MTTNDGGPWTESDEALPWCSGQRVVSRVEASHFDTATVYVTFDNHRENDFNPYLYVSNDFGSTFRSIATNLPTGGPDFVHVIREDPYNRDLLFVGTDVGAYVSTNRGGSWQRFMKGCHSSGSRSQNSSARSRADRCNARAVDLDRRHRSP